MENNNSDTTKKTKIFKKERQETERLVVYLPLEQYNRLVENLNEYNKDSAICLDMSKFVRMKLQEVLV